jgi:hypothetical protein
MTHPLQAPNPFACSELDGKLDCVCQDSRGQQLAYDAFWKGHYVGSISYLELDCYPHSMWSADMILQYVSWTTKRCVGTDIPSWALTACNWAQWVLAQPCYRCKTWAFLPSNLQEDVLIIQSSNTSPAFPGSVRTTSSTSYPERHKLAMQTLLLLMSPSSASRTSSAWRPTHYSVSNRIKHVRHSALNT